MSRPPQLAASFISKQRQCPLAYDPTRTLARTRTGVRLKLLHLKKFGGRGTAVVDGSTALIDLGSNAFTISTQCRKMGEAQCACESNALPQFSYPQLQ
jgi:hypothetical protein